MHHKWFLFSFLMFVCAVVFSQEKPSNPFSFKWDNGFKLTSQDNQFALKFGGRLMIDHAYFFQSDEFTENFGALNSNSGTEVRRARIFFSGAIYENTHFKMQVDFAGEEITLKDTYIGLSNLPVVGNFRIGHFKEPFRLSILTSSKYTTLMELGQNESFSQARNNGVMLFNDYLNKRLSLQLSTFRNANNSSEDALAGDGYVVTSRVTGLAFTDIEKSHLLHLGVGYSYRKPDSKQYKISPKPGSNLAPKYIGTGVMEDVDNINLINFETAYIYNSFSFQGEYLNATINDNINSLNFFNYYGEISYFITGENKNYQGSYDGFGRIKPAKNFGGKDKGAGAWEVAFRYSYTDLDDQNIMGGKQRELALGLNWYLNPVTRLMINYNWIDIEDQGNANILQGRIQIDF